MVIKCLTSRFLVLNSCKWHGQEQSQFYKTRQDEMWQSWAKNVWPPRLFRQSNIRINGSQRKIILTIVKKFAWQAQIVPLGIFNFLSTQKQNHYTMPAHENVQFWQFSVLLLTAGASQWRHAPPPPKCKQMQYCHTFFNILCMQPSKNINCAI